MSLKFDDLVTMIHEAKGTKPGERYHNVRNSEPTPSENIGDTVSGVGSSPVGKSNYNPELRTFDQKDPADVGGKDAGSAKRLLTMAMRLLKNDDLFDIQLKGAFKEFKVREINAANEKILKNYPSAIQKQDSTITGLENQIFRHRKTLADQKSSKNISTLESEIAEIESKIKIHNSKKQQYEEILDGVYEEIDDYIDANERINDSVLQTVTGILETSAKILHKQIVKKMGSKPKMTTIPLHELDVKKMEEDVKTDLDLQLQLVETMMSEDAQINPFMKFLDQAELKYENAKQSAYDVSRGDNYSIAIQVAIKNLPVVQFASYYLNTIMKVPRVKFAKSHAEKLEKQTSGEAGMLGKLAKIENSEQFETLKPALKKYINDLNTEKLGMPETAKNGLMSLVDKPFVSQKGRPNSANKIGFMLKSMNITESFDDYAERILKSIDFDIDSFKIDLMEVVQRKQR